MPLIYIIYKFFIRILFINKGIIIKKSNFNDEKKKIKTVDLLSVNYLASEIIHFFKIN